MAKVEAPLVEPTIEILRLQAGAIKHVGSLADNYTGLQTHWTGRTMLCPGTDDCPGCLNGMDRRWLGYLPVLHNRGIEALLEISAAGAPAFDRVRGEGSLLGHVLELQKGRKFEPLKIIRSRLTEKALPVPRDPLWVIDQFARILSLPRWRKGEPVVAWEERLQTAAAARLQLAVRARV